MKVRNSVLHFPFSKISSPKSSHNTSKEEKLSYSSFIFKITEQTFSLIERFHFSVAACCLVTNSLAAFEAHTLNVSRTSRQTCNWSVFSFTHLLYDLNWGLHFSLMAFIIGLQNMNREKRKNIFMSKKSLN